MSCQPRIRRPARWVASLAFVVAVATAFVVAVATARYMTHERADEQWAMVGRVWRSWVDEDATRRMRVKNVVPASAESLWRGLEGMTVWPGRQVEAGNWMWGAREVSWDQRNGKLHVVVRQEREWLAVRTRVEFRGAEPPRALVRAFKDADITVVTGR